MAFYSHTFSQTHNEHTQHQSYQLEHATHVRVPMEPGLPNFRLNTTYSDKGILVDAHFGYIHPSAFTAGIGYDFIPKNPNLDVALLGSFTIGSVNGAGISTFTRYHGSFFSVVHRFSFMGVPVGNDVLLNDLELLGNIRKAHLEIGIGFESLHYLEKESIYYTHVENEIELGPIFRYNIVNNVYVQASWFCRPLEEIPEEGVYKKSKVQLTFGLKFFTKQTKHH